MPKRKYVIKLSPEEKATEMLNKYGQADALVQVKQIICFVEMKDVRIQKYWDDVQSLLINPNFIRGKQNQV
jgi:hypothetical protein